MPDVARAVSMSSGGRVESSSDCATRPKVQEPMWNLALTTHLLPERLRGEFGLVFGERDQRSMNLALARIRRLYPRLPMRIRAVGPYQEAQSLTVW
jgi:uncharacterized protein (DUF2236 family)